MHFLDESVVENAMADALALAKKKSQDVVGMYGYGIVELRDSEGRLKQVEAFANIITTPGDDYYAKKAIVNISPANAAAPTAVNGMKLGTGVTAPSKSGAGAALGSYISGSNKAFDSTYPQTAAVGGDGGTNAVYKTTWNVGEATNSAITEVVMVNDQGTNATSSAANTYARAVISLINKGSGDTLAVTWNQKFLGA